MASQSNLYAGTAGYVGRADQKGLMGVFSRQAGEERWEHVVPDAECFAVGHERRAEARQTRLRAEMCTAYSAFRAFRMM